MRRGVVEGVRVAAKRAPGPGLSLPEAAEHLGATETQVRLMVERGQLRAVRVGSRYRIPASVIAELKAALT